MSKRIFYRRYGITLSALTWLLLYFTAVPSQAHALLVRSVPEAGAELTIAPAAIDLWFSEPLEPQFSTANLVDSTGTEIAVGNTQVDSTDPTHMTLGLPPLAPGIYTVVWHTLSSADGHEWVGNFPLSVLNADGTRPVAAEGGTIAAAGRSGLPTVVATVVRWLSLMGALLLLGAAVFQLWVLPRVDAGSNDLLYLITRDLDFALLAGLIALIVGGWQQLVVQADQLGNAGMVGTLLMQTRTGNLILMRQTLLLILLLGGVLLRQWQPRGKPLIAPRTMQWLTLFFSLLVLGTFSLGSHAAAVAGSGWAILVDYIHLVAAATWLGGLWTLVVLFRRRQQLRDTDNSSVDQLLDNLVQRFSVVATLSVFVLISTGLFSSFVQLSRVSSLWTTSYGQVLLVKVLLMLVALAIAFFNHRLVRTPIPGKSITATDPYWSTRRQAFWRQIRGESWVGVLLVVAIALLVQTPPPTPAQAPVTASIFNGVMSADDLSIHLQIAPNQVGNNRYIAHLYHEDGSPIGEVQLVRLQFRHQTAELGQANLELTAQGAGIFQGEGAYLNRAGPWDLALYIRRRAFDDLLATTSVTVPDPMASMAVPARIPWQNPIPALPTGVLIGSCLLALLALPFLWRYATHRKSQ